MYIDTHAHLNFQAFKDDYKEAIKRAFDNGVKGIINVGSNLETSKKAIEIAEVYNANDANKNANAANVYAAVGLHPIHVADEKFDFDKYLELAKDKKVVAIGETGIDLYHNKKTIDVQRDIFEKSLEIARKVNKPAIMHSRDADNELYSILLGQKLLSKGVVHCFSGDWEFAKKILDFGFLISFTGIITFSKNPKMIQAIRKIPLEKIMIETDCPYLTPEPYRGKRNEPAYVIEIAKKIAEIKNPDAFKGRDPDSERRRGILIEQVEKQTSQNAINLFGLNL